MTIDLRSDTVTLPTPEMRQAMAQAELGDDVYAEDPTVRRLEQHVASLLGKEAALLMPSGTMSNQIGVRIHCSPGDEFLCEASCHIYNYEQAGFAQLSGLSARVVPGTFGELCLQDVEKLIRPANDNCVRTRLVCLENTHNRGAGRVLSYDNIREICTWAHANGLATHLDGARLFNAVIATGIPARRWAQHFDTVSICFSKGLGAPMGSALAGSTDLIFKAKRARRLFGGGLRQAGVIAAAALYALENHVERLAADHQLAQIFAEAIKSCAGLKLRPIQVDTNIVIFCVNPRFGSATDFVKALDRRGVRFLPIGDQMVRAVTHLNVCREDVQRAADIVRLFCQETQARKA